MYDIDPNIDLFRQKFEAKFPEATLDKMDWLRCSYAMKFLVGTSLLDVGPGVGMILNAAEEQMAKMTAIDIRRHSQAIFPDKVTYIEQSITDDVDLSGHDTVICMEVIEHLEPEVTAKALSNLRTLSNRRLLLSTPYNEPEPYWYHDKPGGHRQGFKLDRLATLFPTAYATILPRYGVDWCFIIEDKDQPAPYFQIVSRPRLRQILAA